LIEKELGEILIKDEWTRVHLQARVQVQIVVPELIVLLDYVFFAGVALHVL
jgi:hypothetical protein